MKHFFLTLLLLAASCMAAKVIECPVSPTNLVDCTDVTDWTVEDAIISIAQDTTDYVIAPGSLEIALDADGAGVGDATYKYVEAACVATLYNGVGIAFKAVDLEEFFILRVELHNATGYWYIQIQDTTWAYVEQGAMAWYWIPYYKFTESGVTAWGVGNEAISITSIRLKLRRQAGITTDHVISVGAIQSLGKPKAAIIFDFDDSTDTQYSAGFPLFQQNDFAGCMNVIPSLVGGENRTTLAQLQEMDAAGWDICSHTWDTTTLDSSSTVVAVMRTLSLSQAWLVANGFHRGQGQFVPPGNNIESVGVQGRNLVRYMYQMSRGTNKGSQFCWDITGTATYIADTGAGAQTMSHTGTVATPVNPWIPADWSQLAHVSIGSGYTVDTLAEMEAVVDHAIAVGGVCLFATHGVKASPGVGDIATADLSALLAYCKLKEQSQQLDVITKTDWWNLTHGRDVVQGKSPEPRGLRARYNH